MALKKSMVFVGIIYLFVYFKIRFVELKKFCFIFEMMISNYG